jgi:transposase
MEAARSVMTNKKKRHHYTPEEKVAILRRHMVDKVPVSEVCNERGIQPSVFYQWQKVVLDNLAAALTTPPPLGPSRREKDLASENTQLKARLAKKDSVIAEISAEYVQLKKELGEP